MKVTVSPFTDKDAIRYYYGMALKDNAWKTTKPVYDISELFNEPRFQRAYTYRTEFTHAYSIIGGMIANKYTNCPAALIPAIYDEYVCKDLHVFPSTELTEKQEYKLRDYIKKKIEYSYVSNGFPFPKAIDPAWKLVYDTHFGIRAFCYDLYQPILMEHRTRPTTFRDRTVGILMQCPTVCYDQPEQITKHFPVAFMLCNPFFTKFREVPKYMGDCQYKMSLLDMFGTEYTDHVAEQLDINYLYHNIDCLYNDPGIVSATKTLLDRVYIKDKPMEWILARDKIRRTVQTTDRLVMAANIAQARYEANLRESADRVKTAEETTKAIQKDVEKLRLNGI